MGLAILIASSAAILAALVHAKCLSLAARGTCGRSTNTVRAVICFGGVFGAYVVSISIYAVLYWLLHSSAFEGGLIGRFAGSAGDYLYFSMMNLTTLGVGDVKAAGYIRLVAGLQALLGFVLIGWSAAFTYVVMKPAWDR